MAGKTDKAKGRVKVAAGRLVKSKSLKRDGTIDQIVGSVKEAVGNALDSVRGALQAPPAAKRKRSSTAARKKK